MIGFSYSGSLLGKIIRFFTNSDFSHTFIKSEDTVLEAALLVQHVPFNKYYKNDKFEKYIIFDILNVSEEQKQEAFKKCFDEFAGEKYGKLQLIWFIYRAIMERLGKDVRKEKNWLSDGVICSELVYYYLKYLGFYYLIEDFNPDTIQPEDIRLIVINNPHLFKLKE